MAVLSLVVLYFYVGLWQNVRDRNMGGRACSGDLFGLGLVQTELEEPVKKEGKFDFAMRITESNLKEIAEMASSLGVGISDVVNKSLNLMSWAIRAWRAGLDIGTMSPDGKFQKLFMIEGESLKPKSK